MLLQQLFDVLQQLIFYSLMEQDQRPTQGKGNILLAAKEALDERHINGTALTLQSAAIVLKLFHLINKLQQAAASLKRPGECSCGQTEAISKQLEAVIIENNNWHLQQINLKDQIYSLTTKLKQVCDKIWVQKEQSGQQQLAAQNKQTQVQLRRQLTTLSFKYNELMDLIHQDYFKERHYLKRLLKHKHAPLEPTLNSITSPTSQVPSHSELQQRLSTLQARLLVRDQQVKRLQLKFQNQCLALAKETSSKEILCNKIKLLEQKISKLSWEVIQLSKENIIIKKAENKISLEELHKIKRVKSLKHNQNIEIVAEFETQENVSEGQQTQRLVLNPAVKKNKNGFAEISQRNRTKQREYMLLKSALPTKEKKPSANTLVIQKSNSNTNKANANCVDQGNKNTSDSLKSPLKITSQEQQAYLMLLRQKQQKIKQLQQLLIRAHSKTQYHAPSINARNTETKSFLINQHHNQYINQHHNQYIPFNPSERRQDSERRQGRQYSCKLEKELETALNERSELISRVAELQAAVVSNSKQKERECAQKNSQNHAQNQSNQLMKNLFQANQENISLQLRLNQALATINALNVATHQQPSSHGPLYSFSKQKPFPKERELLKERNELLMQIDTLSKQNSVLAMQLRETQRQLQIQRRDMTAFESEVASERKQLHF